MQDRLIELDRSIIVAADCDPDRFPSLVRDTHLVEGVSGFKVGFVQIMRRGVKRTSAVIKSQNADSVIIYDHQKAGNDIPDVGVYFAQELRRGYVDAAIIFPFTGPKTQEAWTKALQDQEIKVIVGAEMTHPGFMKAEGGYFTQDDLTRMYVMGAEMGVRDFVMPGNKPESIDFYRRQIMEVVGSDNFDIYSPGFVRQNGVIADMIQVAGPRWHAIVGRGIFEEENPRQAAINNAAQIWEAA